MDRQLLARRHTRLIGRQRCSEGVIWKRQWRAPAEPLALAGKGHLPPSGAAPISAGSQQVRARRRRECHRQASVLTKCLSDGGSRTPPSTLPPRPHRVNQHGCTISPSNLDLSRPLREWRRGSGPFRQPADLTTARDNGFICDVTLLNFTDI